MARTILTIKADLDSQFMTNSTIASAYGFTVGDSFDDAFSKVSIESILLYIMAYCAYVVEVLFDTHKTEVNDIIDTMKPHTRNWYETMAKSFLFGYSLVEDEDFYDTSLLTDDQITSAKVVQYAAAVEKSGIVYLKIAGGDSNNRAPLPSAQKAAFEAYIKEIKDAGVVVEVVNSAPQYFGLQLTVYYDPTMLDSTGLRLTDGTYPVKSATENFISTLKFNGEYRNVSLVDILQDIDGVIIPELVLSRWSNDGSNWEVIDAKITPDSGYFKIYDETHLAITYVAYQSISV